LTLKEALELAVESLPPIRRKLMKRRIEWMESRRPNDYQDLLLELTDKLANDARCASIIEPSLLSSVGFSPEKTTFKVKNSSLEELFKLIIEYLPKILEIVMMFINGFGSLSWTLVLLCAWLAA